MKARYSFVVATGLLGALALLALTFGGTPQRAANAQLLACRIPIDQQSSVQQLPFCLEIVKLTEPSSSSKEFNFTVLVEAKSEESFDFELGHEDVQFIGIDPNFIVTITEHDSAGWHLSDIDCDGDFMVLDEGDNFIQIEIVWGPNERAPEVVCTFTNTQGEDDVDDERSRSRPNVGGAFAGDGGAAERNRARANAAGAAAAAAVAPAPAASVRPPSTGDGGLLP